MPSKIAPFRGDINVGIPGSDESLIIQRTYVSGDELERAEALTMGYDAVCQHPKEVGRLGSDDSLVIDFDHVLFDEKAKAASLAFENARTGVPVGVHTYHPEHPLLKALHSEPNVVIAKTHRLVRMKLLRLRSK
jgi:hypothetical protein